MKTFSKTLIVLGLLAAIIFTGVQVAGAAANADKALLIITKEGYCIGFGGSWSGPTSTIGVCTYAPGTAGHTNSGQCSDSQYVIISYAVVYVPDQNAMRFARNVSKPLASNVIVASTRCEDIPSIPGFGKCGNSAEKTAEPVTIVTCQGVSVAFDAGTCTGKCTVGPKVLNTANKGLSQLDGEVLSSAYVKVRNPGGGSYKICMPGEGTIYKWVSGAWVAQSTQTVDGVSCAWSSGDGNYVLVGP